MGFGIRATGRIKHTEVTGSALQKAQPRPCGSFSCCVGHPAPPQWTAGAIPQICLTSSSFFPLSFFFFPLCKHLSLFYPLSFFGCHASP